MLLRHRLVNLHVPPILWSILQALVAAADGESNGRESIGHIMDNSCDLHVAAYFDIFDGCDKC